MQPLSSTTLRGTWCTLLLPVREDNSIDFGGLKQQIDRLVDCQVDGIYCNGTAGEFESQSEDDFDRIARLLADKCQAAAIPFQIGISHTSAVVSRARLRRTRHLRPGAFQLILPDWSPLALRETLTFLQTMAEEAGGVPLVLYNPPHAKRVLSPAEWGWIAERVPALIGIKVLGGDAAWFARIGESAPNLAVFVAGHLLAEQTPHGAHGSYSNVACLHPSAAQSWHRQMQSDIVAAQELGKRIQAFLQQHIVPWLEQGYSNQAVDKLLASVGGWTTITPRLLWPFESIATEEADRLRPIARAMLPEFFPSLP